MRRIRGRRISMVLQDPKFSLNPVMTVGSQIVEAIAHQYRRKYGSRASQGAGDAEGGADKRSRAGLFRLSA